MGIINPDGSLAELSGNGLRQAALYLHHRHAAPSRFFLAGPERDLAVEILSPQTARMDLGHVELRGPVEHAGLSGLHLIVGNPQTALEIQSPDQLEQLDLSELAPPIEHHRDYPTRSNVSFWCLLPDSSSPRIRARIWERGVGETSASGTGAAGAALAAILTHGLSSPLEIELPGGALTVELEAEASTGARLWLTGPAQLESTLTDPALELRSPPLSRG